MGRARVESDRTHSASTWIQVHAKLAHVGWIERDCKLPRLNRQSFLAAGNAPQMSDSNTNDSHSLEKVMTRALQKPREAFNLSCVAALLVASIFSGCNRETPSAQTGASTKNVAAASATSKSEGLPPECDAYIRTVTACVEKVGASNPAVASFKQQLDVSRSEWAKVPDKTAFAASCKQMDDSFKATAAPALKC